MKARLVVESGDWARMKGQGSFDNIDELLALGMASIPLRDPGRADAAFEQLTNAAKTIPDQDAREVAAIMAAELEGLIKLGRSDRTGALAALARAAQLESKRPRPVARPYPIKPAGELYGEILLGTADAKAAAVQFKAALARTPGRAASLLGLARATSVTGPPADAARAAKAFLAAWHIADKDRPELAEMRALVPIATKHTKEGAGNQHERHERENRKIFFVSFVPTAVQFRAFRGDRRDQTSSMTTSRT